MLDGELAARAVPDEDALGDLDTLYRRHAAALTRFLARLGGPRPDLEDLVHDVFLRADAERGGFRGASSVRTWLFGIAHNVLRARRRRDARRRWLLLARRAELTPPSSVAPGTSLEAEQAWAKVQRLLARLPERDATVLVLFELEELTGAEVAEVLQISVAAVWVRLSRARERFRRLVDEEALR